VSGHADTIRNALIWRSGRLAGPREDPLAALDALVAENQQLRDALERMDGVARSAIAFVLTPYKRAELELRRISASALAGTPSEDT
jgi:hypothetical protein